jgi:type VI secretion system protein ImpA
MSALVEKILQPVSGDQPCGPDLANDPRFDAIEQLLKGHPEIEMGSVVKPAEPPEWRELKAACIDFLGASKHLRPAVILCCSLLKLEGLAGFRDGLQIIRGLVEQHWAQIHPLLDPEDGNDPQQRLNTLSTLTAPRLSVTGWLQVADYLYKAPLCRPKGVPPLTLDDLAGAKKAEAGGEGASAPAVDTAQVNRAFQSANPEEIKANHEAVTQCLEAIAGLDAFLTSTLGAGGTINFEDLRSVLQQMDRLLGARLAGDAPASGEPAELVTGESAPASGGSLAAIPVSGAIRSRGDVVRTLDSICEYYRQIEPGSPVPLLLRRAQKLASMNFVQAMQELALASPDQLRPAMGSVVDETAGAAAATSSEAPSA